MKLWSDKTTTNDSDERLAVESLRALLGGGNATSEGGPSDAYWSNLIVRTNQRIDEVTSVKALSLSWVVRVAIPGVVAIIFFFIGLHYYVPDRPAQQTSLASVVLSMPAASLDSLLSEPTRLDESISVADIHSNLLDVSSDQASEYVLASEDPTSLLATMTDEQVNRVIAKLASTHTVL
jgi:hypothetical protein